MGNNRGLADQGRFSSDHPKTPKKPKCRTCNYPIQVGQDWHYIGGKRYHKECR